MTSQNEQTPEHSPEPAYPAAVLSETASVKRTMIKAFVSIAVLVLVLSIGIGVFVHFEIAQAQKVREDLFASYFGVPELTQGVPGGEGCPQLQTAKEAAVLVNRALQEQNTNAALSFDTYQKLIAIDSRYSECLKNSAKGLSFDQEKAEEITASLISDKRAELEDIRDTAEDSTLKLMYSVAISEMDGLTSAYQRWKNAQDTPDSGAMYSDACKAFKTIDSVLNNTASDIYGETGRQDFKAAVDFVVGDIDMSDSAAWDKAIATARRYLGESKSGIGSFLSDMMAKGFIDENFQIAEGTTLEQIRSELVDGITLSEDLVRAIFGELENYEFHTEWASEEDA